MSAYQSNVRTHVWSEETSLLPKKTLIVDRACDQITACYYGLMTPKGIKHNQRNKTRKEDVNSAKCWFWSATESDRPNSEITRYFIFSLTFLIFFLFSYPIFIGLSLFESETTWMLNKTTAILVFMMLFLFPKRKKFEIQLRLIKPWDMNANHEEFYIKTSKRIATIYIFVLSLKISGLSPILVFNFLVVIPLT